MPFLRDYKILPKPRTPPLLPSWVKMNSCCDLYGSFPDARRRLPGEDHLRGDRLPPVQELQELRADARLRRRLAVERARALDGGRSRRGVNLGCSLGAIAGARPREGWLGWVDVFLKQTTYRNPFRNSR